MDSLLLSRNPDVTHIEVHILPAQSECLALAKAHRQSHRIERFKTVSLDDHRSTRGPSTRAAALRVPIPI